MCLFSGKRTYNSVFLPTKGRTLYYLSDWRTFKIGDVVNAASFFDGTMENIKRTLVL